MVRPLMNEHAKMRKRLNAAQRRELRAAAIVEFQQKAGRKAQKGWDPNDRRYDPDFAKALRRSSPLEIYDLTSFDEKDG